MKGHCDILSCKYSKNYSKEDVSTHLMPLEKDLHEQWLNFFQHHHIEVSRKRARICDMHFTEDSFERDLKSELMNNLVKMNLKKNAVPTIYETPNKKKKFDIAVKKAGRKAIVENFIKEHEEIKQEDYGDYAVCDFNNFKQLEHYESQKEEFIQLEPDEIIYEESDKNIKEEPEEKSFKDSSVQCDLLEELWEESIKIENSKIYKCLDDLLDILGKPRIISDNTIQKLEEIKNLESNTKQIIEKQCENSEDYDSIQYIDFQDVDSEYDTKEMLAVDSEENEYETRPMLEQEYENIEYIEDFENIRSEAGSIDDEIDTHKKEDEDDTSSEDEEFDKHFVITPKIVNYKNLCIIRNDGYYQCNKCNKLIQTPCGVLKHYEIHSEQSLICSFCGNLYTNHRSMVHHTSVCRFRPSKYNIDSEIDIAEVKNKLRQKEKVRHICQLCKKELKSKFILYDHMNVHTKEKPYQCSCGTKFGHMENFRTHLRNMKSKNTMCPTEGRIIPDYAPRIFLQLTTFDPKPKGIIKSVRKEVNVDANRKIFIKSMPDSLNPEELFSGKFNCSICNRAFSSKEGLRKHKKLHLERKYKCDQCVQKFHSATLLKIHVVNEHNLQKKCEHCNKIFSRSRYANHMRKMVKETNIKTKIEIF